MARNDFQPLALPLAGPLDTRSRPSVLLPGWWRWKLNEAVNRSGHLERRGGHAALSLGEPDVNTDAHRVGTTREPITFLQDAVKPDGEHLLVRGTESGLYWLNNTTSEWASIATGLGGEGRSFKGAVLRDKALYTNNQDEPLQWTLGGGAAVVIPELQALTVTKAKVTLEFNGVVLLFNTLEGGGRFSARIRWSNIDDLTAWNPATGGTVTGFLDLPYGDAILNACVFNGAVWVFTESGIWKLVIAAADADSIFSAVPVYTEPRNRTGCLFYENTLLVTDKDIVYAGRDSIYLINQYLAAPVSEEWMLKASGTMFEGDARIDPRCCASACACYVPDRKEMWFSYPRITDTDDEDTTCLNDYTLVLTKSDELLTPIRTGDYADTGYSSFVNFARPSTVGQECKVAGIFIGASSVDYCLKDIGNVFYREFVTLIDNDPANDIPDAAYATTQVGYVSRIVGQIPAGYPRDDKVVRNVLLEHDTVEMATPNVVRLRIGGAFKVVDPMETNPSCGPLWKTITDELLKCPDGATVAEMLALNQRPSQGTEFHPYEQAKYLYMDLSILSPSGGAPIGSNSAWSDLVFEVMVMG